MHLEVVYIRQILDKGFYLALLGVLGSLLLGLLLEWDRLYLTWRLSVGWR